MFPPNMHGVLSSCLPVQFCRRILSPMLLGFGRILLVNPQLTRHFALLNIVSVVPLGISVVSGWPPDWSLLRGAFKPHETLSCLWRYALFFNHVQVHEMFV
eukprot:168375-Chlamydomonas_euryale.AAC.3